MKPNFEIKYLELKWYDSETLTQVTEAVGTLRIEYDNDRDVFQSETSIYPRLEEIKRGQLAIRFLNNADSPPYVEMPDGQIKYLTSVKDPDTDKAWWILQDKWDDSVKQWCGIAPNVAGTVHFVVQNQLFELNISGFDFTREQLSNYLQTFKNDLWELILDDSSPAQAEAKKTQGLGVNEQVIDCVNSLVSSAQKILITPKIELREVQALKPRKSVKPVNRTFMELATKTNQRYLTSRATVPSYDVAENRYVLFALERCYRIIKQIVILANNKKQRYQATIEKLQNQRDAFSDTIQVNKELVRSDLMKIRKRAYLAYWQEDLKEKIINNNIDLQSQPCSGVICIKLEGYTKNQVTEERDGFFVRVWNNGEWVKPNNKTGILSLRSDFSDLMHVFEPGISLIINCDYEPFDNPNSFLFKLKSIHSIKLIDHASFRRARDIFIKERSVALKLKENNWTKRLSKRELEEQDKEKKSLLNRIEFYSESQKRSVYVYEKVEPKLRALKGIINKFKKLEIKTSSYFPNSMTFVQNPSYQGVHNNYKTLRDITSLNDDELLISLEEIDEIGLVNMPLLYERWVLMQLLLVLKESFRFEIQGNWRYQLIDAVKNNKINIHLDLVNKRAKRKIVLWYERELPNGKRPDYILDVIWRPNDSSLDNKLAKQRFVLDAKFYDKSTFNRAGGMMAKIDELYVNKNYSEDEQNPVFIIHPSRSIIEEQKTAQDWGKYSFLGEIDVADDGRFYNHNKGAVLLNPIGRDSYSDELQRLLGLFLQYKLEPSNVNESDTDATCAIPICIRCGSTGLKEIHKSSGYFNSEKKWVKRTLRSVWLQCKECEQMQIYNHCADKNVCNTRLVKNGLYWSYHSARALEPFNMKCPACGGWGAW